MTTHQSVVRNTKYEILTPRGWEFFSGMTRNLGAQPGVKITTTKTSIRATNTHRFYSGGRELLAEKICVGDLLDAIDGTIQAVRSIENIIISETYDIVETASHLCYANGLTTHQCDEFAFVRPNMATEFWTSIQPVLSTGGSCIITSTPKSDEDQFAQIWQGANDNLDEYGQPLPKGLGRNDFFPIKVKWDAHPERDETWAKPFRNSLGPAKFAQEFECVVGSTKLDLLDTTTGEEVKLTISQLTGLLGKDLDDDVV